MTLRSRLEILAAIATAVLHPVFVDWLHLRALFIVVAFVGWFIYVVRSVRRDPSLLRIWGLSSYGLSQSTIASGIVAGIGVLFLMVVAVVRGSLVLHWHMLPLLVLYPVWGLAQQFMVQAIIVCPLAFGPQPKLRPPLAALLAALLFGMVHLPDPKLTAATFLLGLAFTPIYLRWRNLWPLGVFHGWLGIACFFWLLERDPWVELFQVWT
jgi:hypothetical protein